MDLRERNLRLEHLCACALDIGQMLVDQAFIGCISFPFRRIDRHRWLLEKTLPRLSSPQGPEPTRRGSIATALPQAGRAPAGQ